MLSPEAIAHRDAQRKAFRDYMAGPHDKPLVIERHAEYGVEEVLVSASDYMSRPHIVFSMGDLLACVIFHERIRAK